MAKLFFARDTKKRTEWCRLRLTPAEKRLLLQRAEDAGVSLSSFMLNAALSRPMRSQVAATIINELIILNDQLKTGAGTGTADVLHALEAVEKLIQRLPMQLEDDLNSP
jgi:uncharacterized protein (DUF1778 family)